METILDLTSDLFVKVFPLVLSGTAIGVAATVGRKNRRGIRDLNERIVNIESSVGEDCDHGAGKNKHQRESQLRRIHEVKRIRDLFREELGEVQTCHLDNGFDTWPLNPGRTAEFDRIVAGLDLSLKNSVLEYCPIFMKVTKESESVCNTTKEPHLEETVELLGRLITCLERAWVVPAS